MASSVAAALNYLAHDAMTGTAEVHAFIADFFGDSADHDYDSGML